MENIIINILRSRARFETPRGFVSAEDVFALNTSDLNATYQKLKAKVSALSEDSLIESKAQTKEDKLLADQIEFVKFVYKQKDDEAKARTAAASRRLERERLANLLAEKKDEALRGKSVEEIEKMLSDLAE